MSEYERLDNYLDVTESYMVSILFNRGNRLDLKPFKSISSCTQNCSLRSTQDPGKQMTLGRK